MSGSPNLQSPRQLRALHPLSMGHAAPHVCAVADSDGGVDFYNFFWLAPPSAEMSVSMW